MKRPEQALHIEVAKYLALAIPDLTYFHVPNSSGNRGPGLGGIMKAMGVRPGVPDFCFVLPHGAAAFIELKAGKGKLSPSQQAFKASLPLGALWAEARSIAEVQEILERWLTPFGWNLRARVSA